MAAMFGRVIQTFAVLAFVLAACGKRELGGGPPSGGLGGAGGQDDGGGSGGATSAVGAGGQGDTGGQGGAGAPGGSGGVPRVSSGCIFNGVGTPVPIVDIVDPGPVYVACQGSARSPAVIRIGDDSGQGFDWRASVVSGRGALRPDIGASSACPGYGLTGVGIIAAFPDNASAGDADYGYLVIDTTYPGLPQVQAEVIAFVVPSEFALDLVSGTPVPPGTASDPLVVDFGAVPVGGFAEADAQVRNVGMAPLTLVHPTAPPSDPFSFVSWDSGGEDPVPPPPVQPGYPAPIHFRFQPSASGSYSADVELTPFRSTPGARCGSNVHVLLRGSATLAP
jgi:hypothetical protein